jgi:hypothetical protein
MADTLQNIERWYRRRKDAVSRRDYWKSKLDAIASAAREYFESGSFEMDPVTNDPVFRVVAEPMDGFFHTVIRIETLPGPSLTLGVPLDSADLVLHVGGATFAAENLYENGRATEMRLTHLRPLASELMFPTGLTTQMPRSLSYVFGSFAEAVFR